MCHKDEAIIIDDNNMRFMIRCEYRPVIIFCKSPIKFAKNMPLNLPRELSEIDVRTALF
jgi:hypothetical protein